MSENLFVTYVGESGEIRREVVPREMCRLATHFANQLEELDAADATNACVQVSSTMMKEREFERCLAFMRECQAFFARQKADHLVALSRNHYERLRAETWVTRHIPADYPALFALLEAAHQIACDPLLNILAAVIAKTCIGKTAAEIRTHFGGNAN